MTAPVQEKPERGPEKPWRDAVDRSRLAMSCSRTMSIVSWTVSKRLRDGSFHSIEDWIAEFPHSHWGTSCG